MIAQQDNFKRLVTPTLNASEESRLNAVFCGARSSLPSFASNFRVLSSCFRVMVIYTTYCCADIARHHGRSRPDMRDVPNSATVSPVRVDIIIQGFQLTGLGENRRYLRELREPRPQEVRVRRKKRYQSVLERVQPRTHGELNRAFVHVVPKRNEGNLYT